MQQIELIIRLDSDTHNLLEKFLNKLCQCKSEEEENLSIEECNRYQGYVSDPKLKIPY